MKNALIRLFLVATLAFGCQKNKDTAPCPDNPFGLPSASQTSAAIFACRANNESWICPPGIRTLTGSYGHDSLSVTVSAGNAHYFDRLLIRIDGNAGHTSKYSIPSDRNASIVLLTDQDCQGIGKVSINFACTGLVEITRIDSSKKIISGTFSCKIPIENCDSIAISYGRFDISY